MPAFALVVVTHRTAELASRCLRAAAGESPAETVVVDSASGDGSAARLREGHPEAKVLELPTNAGFAAAVNAGVAETTAPIVLLLNADTEPRPGALRALAEHLERSPRAGVAAPRLVHGDGTAQASAYRRTPGLLLLAFDLCLPAGYIAERVPAIDPYRVPPQRWRTGAHVAHVCGAALAVRRTAFTAAGPFDEGFFLYLEETEWQERVRAAGFTIELVPQAEVMHLGRGGDALAPSVHFVSSMRRYLQSRGRSPALIDAAINAALLLSRAAARAERLVVPAERRTDGARAAAYDALWRAR